MSRQPIGARIACVSFSPPRLLTRYAGELGLPGVMLLCDPDRALYAAFGFRRAGFVRVWLDPRVWWRYATLLARGRRWAGVGEDTLQLGGDVVLDAAGVVRWVYASRGPEDRPPVSQIRDAAARTRHRPAASPPA